MSASDFKGTRRISDTRETNLDKEKGMDCSSSK